MIVEWVEKEMRTLDLGDRRRNARAKELLTRFASRPEASIPVACGSWGSTKAAYRHLDVDLPASEWLKPHYDATVERSRAYPYVLVLSDTTEFDFTTHPELRGTGPLDGMYCRGLKVHHMLAASPEGVPLGLLDQHTWARDEEMLGQRSTRRTRAPEDKESWKWCTGAEAAAERMPEEIGMVVVCDREADVYFVLAMPRRAGMDLLIRAAHNRRLKDLEQAYLFDAAAQAPVLGETVVEVPRTRKREPRQATMEVRSTHVVLAPPRTGTNGRGQEPVPIHLVQAREVSGVPEGEEPIEWLLLSTRAVTCLDDALWCVQSYTHRWKVERLHYALKSGCRIEDLQLETTERIERALALYSIVAWRLLNLTYHVRADPEAPCTQALEEDERQALTLMRSTRKKGKRDEVPTLREALRQIAEWGGFLGRKGDGEPGVKSLWIGWQQLMAYTQAYRRMRDVGNG